MVRATRPAYVQHGAMDPVTAPVDLDTVRLYRLGRIREQLRKHDYCGGLFLDPLNTRYATDSTNMQVWCTHYETRCALVMTDGPVVLFDYSDLPHLAEGLPTVDEYRVMSVFYYFAAGPYAEEWATEFGNQIAEVVNEHGGGNKRLAVDRLSHLGTDALRSHGIELFDALEVSEVARSIKSPEEITLMEASVEACQAGMADMQAALRPGMTENELWSLLHAANIRQGGEWIETRLLASGPRTNPWFHESSMRVIEEGDLVSFDTDMVGPYGYCADISRSWLCGDAPTDEQKRLYRAAYDQVHHNIEILQPGTGFREYAEKSWSIPKEFEKNCYDCIIHGVGLADEWPNVPPAHRFEQYGFDGQFEPGMVICVESYVGSEGGTEGVKLEQMVHITESGNRVMSTYPFEDQLLQE